MALTDFNIYIGSEIGLLKGVNTDKGKFSNLNSLEGLEKEDEITSMSWKDFSEKAIYTGHKNQVVRVFDCENQTLIKKPNKNAGSGPIKGVFEVNNRIVTAVESGIVTAWAEDEDPIEIDAGNNLNKMTQNPFTPNQIATGGEENELKIWDLQKTESPIFTAKNVKNDFLDLRVPVWITDMKFRTNEKIVTCTRHHQIRIYDTKAQRRPVIDMEFERYPLMCLSLAHNENQIVVGSSRGRLALIDLRKKLLVHVFKGFAGSIRSVACHPTLPLVASCGLDRFARVHDLNEHRLLNKIYLKTRLNCLLFKTDQPKKQLEIEPAPDKEETEAPLDDLWSSMEVVQAKKSKKQRTV